jgi:hypothetical protein
MVTKVAHLEPEDPCLEARTHLYVERCEPRAEGILSILSLRGEVLANRLSHILSYHMRYD